MVDGDWIFLKSLYSDGARQNRQNHQKLSVSAKTKFHEDAGRDSYPNYSLSPVDRPRKAITTGRGNSTAEKGKQLEWRRKVQGGGDEGREQRGRAAGSGKQVSH